MLLVKCPKCGKDMKCAPRVPVTEAVKRCVYCGRSFKIHSNLKKSRIVKRCDFIEKIAMLIKAEKIIIYRGEILKNE